eukprot:13643524-Alexandrium_andersonii.AAC.1
MLRLIRMRSDSFSRERAQTRSPELSSGWFCALLFALNLLLTKKSTQLLALLMKSCGLCAQIRASFGGVKTLNVATPEQTRLRAPATH